MPFTCAYSVTWRYAARGAAFHFRRVLLSGKKKRNATKSVNPQLVHVPSIICPSGKPPNVAGTPALPVRGFKRHVAPSISSVFFVESAAAWKSVALLALRRLGAY